MVARRPRVLREDDYLYRRDALASLVEAARVLPEAGYHGAPVVCSSPRDPRPALVTHMETAVMAVGTDWAAEHEATLRWAAR